MRLCLECYRSTGVIFEVGAAGLRKEGDSAGNPDARNELEAPGEVEPGFKLAEGLGFEEAHGARDLEAG